MGKFTLTKSVGAGKQEKRPLEETQLAEQRPKKGFRASDVVLEEDGPKPKKASFRKFSSNAPIEVIIHKYSDCAGDSWQNFRTETTEQALYQVRACSEHETPRAIAMNSRLIASLAQYS